MRAVGRAIESKPRQVTMPDLGLDSELMTGRRLTVALRHDEIMIWPFTSVPCD